MAVTYRSFNGNTTGGASPLPCGEPTGTVPGDAIFAVFISVNPPISLPAGWTELFSGSQGSWVWSVGWILRGGSAPDLNFTFTGTGYAQVDIITLQTSGGTIRLDSQSTSGASGSGVVLPDPPATVADAASSLAVAFGVHTAGFFATAPAGYVEHDATNGGVGLATKSLSASGSEDPGAFGQSGSIGSAVYWHGGTVTFTDAVVAADTLWAGNCQ